MNFLRVNITNLASGPTGLRLNRRPKMSGSPLRSRSSGSCFPFSFDCFDPSTGRDFYMPNVRRELSLCEHEPAERAVAFSESSVLKAFNTNVTGIADTIRAWLQRRTRPDPWNPPGHS